MIRFERLRPLVSNFVTISALAVASVGILLIASWTLAQPPKESDPESSFPPRIQLPPESQSPTETLNPATPPMASPVTGGFQSDPLFQEIQKMILNGQPNANSNNPKSFSDTDRSLEGGEISNERWHAVESILNAARLLERDVTQAIHDRKFEDAAQTQLAIRNLRFQATELLRKH